MRFSVLASGSRANCTFLEAGGKRILIDCGLSAKQIEIRLGKLGVSAESLDAIFITHEHRDHIQGVSVLSRRYKLPVFSTEATAEFISAVYTTERVEAGTVISFGSLEIVPFQIVHDAVDPVGFIVKADGFALGHATDLGKTTPLVRDALRSMDALVLESNHDHDLLRECEYPWVLKQRISSSHGHLSNDACAELLAEVVHVNLSLIVLAHLSENSNRPELALESAKRAVSLFTSSERLHYRPHICVGTPRESTELFALGDVAERACAHGA